MLARVTDDETPLKHPSANLPVMLSARQHVFSVTWLAYAGFYLCRKNFSVVIPLLISHEGLSKGDLANAVACYSLAYSIGQFTMGGLADRFGARRIVSIGLSLTIAANVAIGFWYGAWALCLLLALNGFAQASGWPGLVKIMGAWFGKAQRGVVMAWWSTNYALGGFAATLIATWVLTHGTFLASLEWRRGMWIPAFILLPIALLFAIGVRESPSVVNSQPQRGLSLGRLREVFRSSRLQLIAVVYFILKLTRYSFLFWLPLYMTEQLRYSASEAGYSSAIFELAGFFGVLAAGYISDRFMGSRRFPAAALLLAVLGVTCLFHPTLSAWSRIGNLVGIALIGMGIFGPDTLLSGAAVQDAAPRDALATAVGTVNGVGSIGQLISPWIVVFIAENYGWNNLFYFFSALSLAGCVLLLAFRLEKRGAFVHEAAS